MEECWCPRVSGIFLSSHQAKCTCIHVYRHEYLFWMVAPASENSHIHSVVYWDTYLHFPWEVGGWGPLKAQPCLVWTSSPVLMTPDPKHILWSGRSTVLRRARDLLMRNLLTWQGARTRTDFRLSDGDTACCFVSSFQCGIDTLCVECWLFQYWEGQSLVFTWVPPLLVRGSTALMEKLTCSMFVRSLTVSRFRGWIIWGAWPTKATLNLCGCFSTFGLQQHRGKKYIQNVFS